MDTITDFDVTANSDSLDLRDLLQGELHLGTAAGNLANYLHFEKVGTTSVLHISSSGGFAADPHTVGAPSAIVTGAEDQKIVLNAIDMIGIFTTDQQVILDLLTKGKLPAD